MEYQDTRAKDIYLLLQSEGFEVYFPGQHVGSCTSEYLVVKQSNTTQKNGLSTSVTYYDILCYEPRKYPAELEVLVGRVKESMRKLWPMICPTYNETAPYFDNEVGGYMTSITYRNYRYLEGGR